jgi:monofunctional biosynthetic peptidoglycan transglycosylase
MQKTSALARFIFALSLLSIAAAGAVFYLGHDFLRTEFPDVSVLRHSFPVVTYLGPEKPAHVSLRASRPINWVGLDDISHVAVGAIIVSEDWSFYQHGGYDPNEIKEAIKEDWEDKGFTRGASTITQQVVRNVFLDKDKNLWRKLKELYLAVRLEQVVGKKKILETYMNVAEWGEGVYGIGQASQFYFHKPPAELTAKEGAFLAMLLPSPKRYSQSFRAHKLTEYARSTIDSILGKMVRARYLTDEESALEKVASLSFEEPLPGSAL